MIHLVWEYESIEVDFITDGHESLDSWVPDNPEDVELWFNIYVGERGSAARTTFDVVIYTKQKFQTRQKNGGQEFLKRVERDKAIIVDKFNWQEIRQKLDAIIESCQRDTWMDSVEELRKHFPWEYDNFKFAEPE